MLQAIKRLFGQATPSSTDPVTLTHIPRDQHPVSRKDISENALKVLYRLNKARHEAYLVGGGVRDILVGLKPKDFDVVTDATPEQVRDLFRNSRIIGRRFKIVHVLFGREVIEVATFRAGAEESEERGSKDEHSRSQRGMLLRDNVYGTLEDDVVRRDFTVNAMYYTPRDFSLMTMPESMRDIEKRLVRIIGNAEQRYREDPVRMLRAVRFAAKLDFDIEKSTAAPIRELGELLEHIPPARLFDDVLKLFMGGYAVRTFELLQEYGLFARLFPDTARVLKQKDSTTYLALIQQALSNTDDRISQGKPVTPAFLYAALLWPVMHQDALQLIANGMPALPAYQQAGQDTVSRQGRRTSIPKRFQLNMREIWEMQLRLPQRHGPRAERLVTHPRFRAAFDFLLLREGSGEVSEGLGQWWEDYQNQHVDGRDAMVKKLGRPAASGKRAPRRRRRPQ
ncbi:polynucleotide adenylyltransferase PcnB [Salinispirillum sp. LH 10-3-1]|uniref:Poly(A) polymerase I n=1 Tax=Salinispirillum sp. LH 10-3-1 TaxID=2952525 RepID=A0AB38YF94_9GAMM